MKTHNLYAQNPHLTSPAVPEKVKQEIKRVCGGFRPGIGTRSKFIFCHPDNEKMLSALLFGARDALAEQGIAMYPYRLKTSLVVPRELPDGNVVYDDKKYVSYADGPSCDMSDEEYKEMCVYFGWAKPMTAPVWVEVNGNSFGNVLDLLKNPLSQPLKATGRQKDLDYFRQNILTNLSDGV